MSDEAENLTPVFLRRLDAKMDRVLEDMGDARRRLTTLEIQGSQLASVEASHYAGMAERFDRMEHAWTASPGALISSRRPDPAGRLSAGRLTRE